ncbi:MAG: prolipoprotein diacylglyceryl transferase [Gammaproteobacteria bacterium]
MLTYPNIDPVAISLGPVKIHWYGITYLVGFLLFWMLGRIRARQPHSPLQPAQVGDLLFYGAFGVVLGGRIGYILFYNFSQFAADPLLIFKIWQGGMSFHGGLLGVVIALWFYARNHKIQILPLADFVSPLTPLALASGRIGNFVNGELWGRVTNVPWGMVFPNAGLEPRHPSQIYQALLEGVALFVILWVYSRHPRPAGAVTGLFLLGYGVFRFIAEFAREPDGHLGFVALGWATMGQVLTVPMIILGAAMMVFAYRARAATAR